MLNRALYMVLKMRYGNVRISRENTARTYGLKGEVLERGEQYVVCCPICGDNKFRATFSHMWLGKNSEGRRIHRTLVNCFNEQCFAWDEVQAKAGPHGWVKDAAAHEVRLLEQALDGVTDLDLILMAPPPPTPQRAPRVAWRLPIGYVPLSQLPANHPAREFVKRKYGGIDPDYLSNGYSVGYTPMYDPDYPLAKGRVIFPVFLRGELSGWQGRAINAETDPRWYLPAGFNKDKGCFNEDRIPPGCIPVFVEGIPTSIACGPSGAAIWGTSMSDTLIAHVASKWPTAVLALDPDTYTPDNRKGGGGRVKTAELLAKLTAAFRIPPVAVTYPPEMIELGRLSNNAPPGTKVSVPDLADCGLYGARSIIKQVPEPHRGWIA